MADDFEPREFLAGVAFGLLMAAAGLQVASLHGGPHEITYTVVTCDNCSYEDFRTVSERILDPRFVEVSESSSRGKRLIEKYELNYVPGFIIEKGVEEHKNFSRIRGSVVEFEDAYVVSDRGNEVAQRFSSGKELQVDE